MNYRGSYKKLLGNAKAAMMAAIEIYNKPTFQYRDECVVILILNAWELVLKALLSKKGQSIFYPKKRKEPYRTLSCQHAMGKTEPLFPKNLHPLPVRRNLELLSTYRDNAVHFYNEKGFGVVIYALAQTSIMNFRDLLEHSFDIKLENEISWQLLPLGIKPPIDPISYISGENHKQQKRSEAVDHFLSELATAVNDVKTQKEDTGRLLTVFNIKLESTKKIDQADIVMGVEKCEEATGPLTIFKRQDPNITHPLRQKDVLEKIPNINGINFTPHTFQSIVWKYDIKNKSQYCWKAQEGFLTKYSNDIISFIKKLSKEDIELALRGYRNFLKSKKVKNKR